MTYWLLKYIHNSAANGASTVWHEIFAGSNFCDFCDCPAIRKNKFPQIKMTAKIFRKNLLQSKYSLLYTQKYSTTKSYPFNYNLPLSFRKQSGRK